MILLGMIRDGVSELGIVVSRAIIRFMHQVITHVPKKNIVREIEFIISFFI
jgi:hypothetical protein